MREITGHKVNAANEKLIIRAQSDPTIGGAPHTYSIDVLPDIGRSGTAVLLEFQNGPIAQGVNGITHEALLTILVDRLECFQTGAFSNPYNAKALEHLRGAQAALKERTQERMARNVEGTHNV